MHVRKCGEKGLKFYVPMTSLENRVPGPFNILVHVPGTCALICYINVYVTAVLIVSHKCKGLLPGTYFYVDILYMYIITVLETRRCTRSNTSTCHTKASPGEVPVRDQALHG